MPKLLANEAVEQYQRDGYYFPIRVLSTTEAQAYRRSLETYEARHDALKGALRHKSHLLFTWANRLVHHPRILDAVEDVLGPNILCWSTSFFIKEPHDPAYVSWHQDSTYWGLEPMDILTAWVALSDVSVASGAMKFLPQSHRIEQLSHTDTFHQDNLLSRGQVIDMDIDESKGVDVPLQAGEMSLHHVRLVHGSAPNTADDRRIGFAIRYIATHVKQVNGRDSAMLVRGVDHYGHFEPDVEPTEDLSEVAVTAHQQVTGRALSYLYKGAEEATPHPGVPAR